MTPAEAIAPLPRLRGLAVRLAGRDGADDLMQDVAVQAIRYCGRINPGHARGWLAKVMYHKATTLRRSVSLDDAPEPAIEADPYWRIRLAEVDALLNRMAAQDRAALIEAAEGAAGCNPRNARAQRLARARRVLVAALGDGA